MSTGALDPLIHDPQRLRIVATLAALPDGDALSVTRLQDLIRLPPGGLITCLRELGRAGYVRTGTTGGDRAPTTVATPDLTVLSARVSLSRRKRARPGHEPGPAPGQGARPHHRGWNRGWSS
jgi:hypothetical protein